MSVEEWLMSLATKGLSLIHFSDGSACPDFLTCERLHEMHVWRSATSGGVCTKLSNYACSCSYARKPNDDPR